MLNANDIERSIEGFAREPNGGLVLPPDTTTVVHPDLIIPLAARHRLPAVYAIRVFVAAGGLMYYGTDFVELYRQAASYVDRILRGAKAADLPVQLPTKFETVVNLKAAKALGLTVPQGLHFVTELQTAASAIGQQIEVVTASTNSDIDQAFATLLKKRTDAFLISPEALFVTRRVQLVSLAARHALPALYHRREFTDAGGLMSYGSDLKDQFRQTGIYAGRILKGEKPAEMPVQLPTKFEFVLNLQAAKTLGLDVPPTLLARADEVID